MIVRCHLVLFACTWLVAAHAEAQPVCGEAEDLSCEPGPDDVPYLHPLKNTAAPGGPVPVLDVLDDPQGRRYAVLDRLAETQGGNVNRYSGLFAYDVSTLSPAEQASYDADKAAFHGGTIPNPIAVPAPVVGPTLAQAVENAAPNDTLPVEIHFSRPALETLTRAMDRAVAEGLVQTQWDWRTIRAERVLERSQAIASLRGAILNKVAELGGTVTYLCQNMPCVSAEVDAQHIAALASLPTVERMDLDQRATADADGFDVASGHQINQFYDAGYDGENTGGGLDITGAVIEPTTMNEGVRTSLGEVCSTHLAFDDSGTLPTRILNTFMCEGQPCASVVPTEVSGHACFVAGLVAADLTDNQDARVLNNGINQMERTGAAREARIYGYGGRVGRAMDHIIGLSRRPHAANGSFSSYTSDQSCLGEDSLSRKANQMFESGILLVKSAGNEGPGDGSECTVGSPGAAIGAFTVGSTGNSKTESITRTTKITNGSSRGGVSYAEGKSRSIVDLVTTGCRHNALLKNLWYGASGCATSFSTPGVTGAMLNFVDAFKHEISDQIDDPGILFVAALLWGSRHDRKSNRRTSGFSNRWGAGRMWTRMPGAAGIDRPAAEGYSSFCVRHGDRIRIPVNNSQPLSNDVNTLKAAAYWYDPRHEDGERIADVDLRLNTISGSTLSWSLSGTDNKERVFSSAVGGQAVELEVHGFEINSDNAGCGTNAARVYVAWRWEDDDREDPDGPDSQVFAD